MFLPIALLLLPLSGQTWTVAETGPADFADLPAAIAAVAPGDTLLVEPGTYSPFVLTKTLTILGAADGPLPEIAGTARVEGAPAFTLAGLKFFALEVRDVPGRALVDDCEVGYTDDLVQGPVGADPVTGNASFTIERCGQVLVSRLACRGEQGFSGWEELPGLEVEESTVVVIDSVIVGGRGGDNFGIDGLPGGAGVFVGPGSEVLIAGSTVRGGDGGQCVLIGGSSYGGHGLVIHGTSTVVLRGSSWDVLEGGFGCGGGPDGYPAEGAGTLVVSGVTVVGFLFLDGLVQPVPPEPYLELGGGAAPGEARRVRVHGPLGAPAFVVLAGAPALWTASGIEGAVWLDPSTLFLVEPVVSGGQDTAVTLLWPIPPDPALIGVSLPLQAAFVERDLSLFATNPASLVVRF